MRSFLKSKEQRAKQLVKDRLRKRHQRRIERAAIEKECQPQIQKLADISKLSELLATAVTNKEEEPNEEYLAEK